MLAIYLVKLSPAESWKIDQVLTKSVAIEVSPKIQNVKYQLVP